MDTVWCRYCGGEGKTSHYDESLYESFETCLVCGGSGQAPVNEDGTTNFRHVFKNIIGIQEFLRMNKKEIEALMQKYGIPPEEEKQ